SSGLRPGSPRPAPARRTPPFCPGRHARALGSKRGPKRPPPSRATTATPTRTTCPARRPAPSGSVGLWRGGDRPTLGGGTRSSTALGLCAVAALAPAPASAQSPAPGRNQVTADAVAATLKASPILAGSRIAIETRDGLVTLTGAVASPAQKLEAIA